MEGQPNPNLAPAVTHQPTLLGGAENIKLLFDECLDNRREALARARAWENLALDQAHTAARRQSNAATFDHFVNMTTANSGQTGETANQQTVSPVRTGAADNVAAGSIPADRIVDTTGAVAAGAVNSATGQAVENNVTAQLGQLVTAVTGLAGLVAQLVQNSKQGGNGGQ